MGTYTAGTTTTYTIVVANGGPTNVAGATVVDNIPAGGSITYTVILTIPAGFTGNLVNTATVTPPAGTTDPTPGNNSATDSDTPACVAVVTACPQGGTLTCAQAQAFVNDPAGLFAFLGGVITVTPANCGTVNITDNFNSTSICGGTFSVTFTITFTRNDSEPIVVSTTQCAQPVQVIVQAAPQASFTSLPGNISINCTVWYWGRQGSGINLLPPGRLDKDHLGGWR